MTGPSGGREPAEFDAYSTTYDAEVNRALAFPGLTVDLFTRVKADYLVELIDRELPPAGSSSLLDVGCGVGNYHSLLAPRLGRIAGIDVSAACIETARERHPDVDYASFDGTAIPHADSTFDAAVAICVFHHVQPAQRAALTGEVRRVLRPGGIFAMFEHNPWNPLTMRVVNRCEFDRDAILLRKSEAEALLVAAGFRTVRTRFILAVPPVVRALYPLDRALSLLPVGAQYYTFGMA
jgi:SAM-dependent methyltransferase